MLTSLRFLLAALVLAPVGASRAQSAETTGRIERILPNDTLAFVSFRNVPRLIERWQRLGLRPPLLNPTLQAVVARVEEQFPQPWLNAKFDWRQLAALPAGDACMAVVETPTGKPAIVIGMDVRGRPQEAIAFFERLGGGPLHANPLQEESLGATHVVDHSNLSYFLKDDLLVVATHPKGARELLRSWPGSKGIVANEVYRGIMEQCQASAEKTEPDICCLVRPIQLLSARMTLKQPKPPMTSQAYLKQAKMTGFDAIRGIGGACWLDRNQHALLYRIGVYSPDRTGWAMKMLHMPNRKDHEPPPWVPGDVEAFGDFYWDMQQAFPPFCKVFSFGLDNQVWEEDVFEDVLNALRDDPNGPQFDIRREFVQRLGDRVLLFRNAPTPDAPVWEHTVVGLKIAEEAAVAKSLGKYIRKCCGSDPKVAVEEHEVRGTTLYEVRERSDRKGQLPVGPEIEFGRDSALPRNQTPRREDEHEPDERRADRPVFVGVAHEYLLWGDDGDLLQRLLTASEPLAQAPRYRIVQHELERLAAGPVCARGFACRGDDFGVLARCMDTQKFFTPFLLEAQNRDTSDPAAGRKKLQAIPTEKAAVGPAGWFAESLPNGWRIVGFALKSTAAPSE